MIFLLSFPVLLALLVAFHYGEGTLDQRTFWWLAGIAFFVSGISQLFDSLRGRRRSK